MSSSDTVTVDAALEGVDKLQVQLVELQKELRELRLQLRIARCAAKRAVRERDFRIQEEGRLKCRLRVCEPVVFGAERFIPVP
jgi:predicted phage tail protein